MCGVLFALKFQQQVFRGSSPRVRGFDKSKMKGENTKGFIPACAGFWSALVRAFILDEVHPRVCGVLICSTMSGGGRTGSSPRVRGFARPAADPQDCLGFIPACAGFWSSNATRWRTVRVHPRVCGVLGGPRLRAVFLEGSSPRVRGFAVSSRRLLNSSGFIPACAGFCVSIESALS